MAGRAVGDFYDRCRLGPARKQVRIVQQGSEKQQLRVVTSPFIAREAMLAVLESKDKSLLSFMARNSAIPEDVQEMIFALKDAPLFSLAVNVMLSPTLQLRFAQGDDSANRQGLALNPGTSREVQHILAGDANPAVRMALASNENLAPEVQVRLSFDESTTVHYNLVRNEGLVRSPQMSARFVQTLDMAFYREFVGPERWEAAQGFMSSWSGSLDDLVKACDLVAR